MVLGHLRLAAGSVLAVAIAMLLMQLVGADSEGSSRARTMVGIAILLWALGILLFGLCLARWKRTRTSFFISLGILVGVAPTILYSCVALLPAPCIASSLAQGVLYTVDVLLLPLDLICSQFGWNFGTYDSHVSAQGLVRSWMILTTANVVSWATVGILLQVGIPICSKKRPIADQEKSR